MNKKKGRKVTPMAATKIYARAECIFCTPEQVKKDGEIAGSHYAPRHGLKVSIHVNIQTRGRIHCQYCEVNKKGTVHDAVRHLAETHREILEALKIKIPGLEKRVTPQEALRAQGFANTYARKTWLDEHAEEIVKHAEDHGNPTTLKEYRMSDKSLQRLKKMIDPPQAPAVEHVIPEGGVLEFLKMGRNTLNEFFDVLSEEYEQLEQKNQGLRNALAASEEEKQRIVESRNERLLKKRTGTKIRLGDLQKAYGRGDDGKRRDRQE
ncbi:hypothetical protein IIA94_00180 [Patescibacteria group bacterium]|nr:hypothetical protein [Patescibacteria group bacterium]